MAFSLSEAVLEDAARLAEIHMASFASNVLMLAAFPTPDILRSLQHYTERKIADEIISSRTSVLVVRATNKEMTTREQQYVGGESEIASGPSTSSNDSKVIAFARWEHPLTGTEEIGTTPLNWPEGTNKKLLEKWGQLVENTQQRVLGETQCYRLNFICTDPGYERLGAATLLLSWGVEKCLKSNHLIYLESTIESAPFYRKHGFQEMANIVVDLGEDGRGELPRSYCEIGFLLQTRDASMVTCKV